MKKIISLLTTLSIVFSVFGALPASSSTLKLSSFVPDEEYTAVVTPYCAVSDIPENFADREVVLEYEYNDDTTIEISTAAELKAFADSVNNGNTYDGKTVTLTSNIDLSTVCGATMGETDMTISWTPIGTLENSFNGTFDGAGHTVSGLYINSDYTYLTGLFGYCNGDSQILNLVVDGSITVGNPSYGGGAQQPFLIGGIAAASTGKIANCHNKTAITGFGNGAFTAGICGMGASPAIIENCINTGVIVGEGRSCAAVARGSDSIIDACYYLADTAAAGGGAEAKTAEQFANGEVAYLLGEAWGQKIGTDEYPVIGGDKVYLVNGEYTNSLLQEKTYPYEITALRFTDAGGNEIIAPEQGKCFIVEADIVKTEERNEKDYLFVAVYDASGALMSLDYVKAKFALDGECSFGFNISAQEKPVGSVKAFVWNTFNSAQPLAEAKILAPVVF